MWLLLILVTILVTFSHGQFDSENPSTDLSVRSPWNRYDDRNRDIDRNRDRIRDQDSSKDWDRENPRENYDNLAFNYNRPTANYVNDNVIIKEA